MNALNHKKFGSVSLFEEIFRFFVIVILVWSKGWILTSMKYLFCSIAGPILTLLTWNFAQRCILWLLRNFFSWVLNFKMVNIYEKFKKRLGFSHVSQKTTSMKFLKTVISFNCTNKIFPNWSKTFSYDPNNSPICMVSLGFSKKLLIIYTTHRVWASCQKRPGTAGL